MFEWEKIIYTNGIVVYIMLFLSTKLQYILVVVFYLVSGVMFFVKSHCLKIKDLYKNRI